MGRQIDTTEFRKITIEVLAAIDRWCDKHHIMYSLACGTLIGAVRHHGFIPWDDDIDIYMLRDDYIRFVADFPQCYQAHYALACLERSSSWGYAYAKAYDVRTQVIEDKRTVTDSLGVGIDIFPIDNAPDDDDAWKSYERKRKLLRGIYEMKELTWRRGRPLYKNLLVECCALLLRPFPARFWALQMDSYARRYNNSETAYVAENCYGLPNNRFPKTDFTSTIELPFEGHTFKAMTGYDDYLRLFYGDYMQLPPIDKQVSTHHYVAYWKS